MTPTDTKPYTKINFTPVIEESVFKFDEDKILLEAIEHIRKTYDQHYSGGIQVTEFIMSHAKSLDWPRANAIKYIVRFGKKAGYNKQDILKALHYVALMWYFAEDIEEQGNNDSAKA